MKLPVVKPPASHLPPLTLYSRPGCHLCEQAEEHLQQLGFVYRVQDISADPALLERYGDHIPVLARNDHDLLRGVLSRPRLSALKLRLLQELDAEKAPGTKKE